MLQTAGHSTGLFKPANNGSMLGYIPSGVDVRVGFVSAGITVEISTTSSANTLALVARLGRVSRVNGHHWHTREGGLIANELFQLVESPRMKPAALFFAARRLPNTGKVFQHNGLPVFFCFLYDVLADLVVSVSLVASLFAAKRAQETAAVAPRRRARPFCCLRLKRPAHPATLLAVGIQLLSSVVRAVRQSGNVAYAAVHSQRVGRLMFVGELSFNLDVDVVVATLFAKHGTCRLVPRKFFTLPVSNIQIKALSALQKRQADRPVFFSKREDALVVVSRRGTENAVSRFGGSQARGNAPKSTNSQVGREIEAFSHVMIAKLLKLVLRAFLMLSTYIRDVVAGVGKRLQRSFDVLLLVRGSIKLARYGFYAFCHSLAASLTERYLFRMANSSHP